MSTPTSPEPPSPVSAAVGYDPLFLSASLAVPLPVSPASAAVRELPSTHFTVMLDLARRLAVATGVNIDGSTLLDLDRGDDWHLDARVAADQQTGPDVYANNDLDRGHLVRRRDPVWGPTAVAIQANFDTFTYTNAAPQAALFNQGETLWAGLEDYVLNHARTYAQRLSVFTAPVLNPTDPPYRGVQIPMRFWKIAAWAQTLDDPADVNARNDAGLDNGEGGTVLAATGYVLDQTRNSTTPTSPPREHWPPVRRRRSAPSRSPLQTSPHSPAWTSVHWLPPTAYPSLLQQQTAAR